MSKACKKNGCVRKCSIGGQALIEGIMMRGPEKSAMAVRNPEGEMILETWKTSGGGKSPAVTRIPFVRGIFNFISSMKAGYRCLMRSAEIAGLEDEDDRKKKKEQEADAVSDELTSEETKEAPKKEEKKEDSKLMAVCMVVATVLGVALAIGLFIMLPSFIYQWFSNWFPFLAPSNAALHSLVKSVFEGSLKILILVGYMLLVTLMKDIRRTFQYHGAEHKTIFCYENDQPLTVENVRKQRRFHPRCGTSFLILMLLVGVFISFLIDPLSILLTDSVPPTWLRALIRLLLLPLIMGVGYELIRLAGRKDNLLTRIISAPGMWLQHITVLEPSDDMIECAIAAFTEVIPEGERAATTEKSEENGEKTDEESPKEACAEDGEAHEE